MRVRCKDVNRGEMPSFVGTRQDPPVLGVMGRGPRRRLGWQRRPCRRRPSRARESRHPRGPRAASVRPTASSAGSAQAAPSSEIQGGGRSAGAVVEVPFVVVLSRSVGPAISSRWGSSTFSAVCSGASGPSDPAIPTATSPAPSRLTPRPAAIERRRLVAARSCGATPLAVIVGFGRVVTGSPHRGQNRADRGNAVPQPEQPPASADIQRADEGDAALSRSRLP